MKDRGRASGLALPFAVVGYAAGWLSDGFLANPLIGVVPHRSEPMAGALGGLTGAALGWLLGRHARTRDALGATRLSILHLGCLVVGAGIWTGGGVGLMETATSWGTLTGALNGGLSAIAFIPVCALVLAAAHRAERARHGSIVAGADRRAVWGILATGLAVMTLLGALEVPAMHWALMNFFPRVSPGLVMAVAAGALLLGILVADARALSRVDRIGLAELSACEPEEVHHDDGVPTVDLGLGDGMHAQLRRAQSAYRGRARALGMLLGSVDEARRALRRALLRGAAGLAVAVAVLAAHAWATTPSALAAYEVQRCAQSTLECYQAGNLYLGREGVTPDVSRAEELFMRGCFAGDKQCCDEIFLSRNARGEDPKRDLPYWYVRP